MEIETLLSKLKNRKDILAVYLFGSHARGSNHKNSDIDICIVPNKTKKEERSDMEFIIDISKDFSDNFDFVNFYRLPIQIKYRVFKEGKEFVCNDEKLLSSVKFNTLNEYFEMKPALDRMYDAILKQGRKHG